MGQVFLRRTVGRKESGFLSVAWSPDGRCLAAGAGDGCVWLFELETRRRLLLEGHLSRVVSVAWSPDGKWLASGAEDTTVRLWDAATGREVRLLVGHQNRVRSVAWSPDGRRLASGSRDITVRIWDVAAGQAARVLEGHSLSVRSVAWSPDGKRLASGSNDNTVRLWDPETGQVVQVLEGHQKTVWSVAWSPDGRWLASGSFDNSVRLWGMEEVLETRVLEGHHLSVRSVAWSPDSQWLATSSDDNTVRIWNVDARLATRVLEGHQNPVISVAWSPDGAWLASGSEDKSVRIWQVATGQAVRVLEGRQNWVWSAAWSPDGEWLASSSSNRSLKVWKATTGRLARDLEGHQNLVWTVAWSPDAQRLASGSADGTVRIWRTATGQVAHILEGHRNAVWSVAWSPDGRWLSSGSDDNTVRVWKASAGAPARVLEGHQGWVRCVAWSPDGQLVVSGSSDNSVRVWKLESGRVTQVMEGHRDWIRCVAWSPDGKWLASGSEDDTVRIWEAATGQAVRVLEGHTRAVTLLRWSDDSSLLASMSSDCEVRLWRLEDGAQVDVLSRLPFRNHPCDLAMVDAPPSKLTCGDDDIAVDGWAPVLSAATPVERMVSAKVAFVGESEVGKSCLALRLAKGEYRELATTHGMQIWPVAPKSLDPATKAPEGETREVVLWDLGGQRHYQLIHQLFLPDTRVALVLFDPTRSERNFEEVEEWDHRLARAGSGIRKLLVRSKADRAGVPDQRRLELMMKERKFDGYFEASAKTGGGVSALGKRILELVEWDSLVRVTRSAEFQAIHERISKARRQERVVLFEQELPGQRDHVDAVVRQLSQQGLLVDLRAASGERVLVLRVEVVDKYAGSLILLAKEHPRGVPVVEYRTLGSLARFPGMEDSERVSRAEERIVLESLTELFVARGLAVQHAGLLVFPSEFPKEQAPDISEVPHRKPLYYDFDGPIDNIWASLVANLAVSGEFGSVRLWANRAEYEQSGRGVFGVYLRVLRRGCGHLDVYFSDETGQARRDLFITYVDDHLRKNGVRLVERLGLTCACEQVIEEEWFRNAFGRGDRELHCPRCGTSYPVLGGAEAALRERPELVDALHVLKTKVEERARSAAEEGKRAVERGAKEAEEHAGDPIRLLHLSDLHFTGTEGVWGVLQPLASDLKDSLKADRLDYVVVSGDFADRCQDLGFDKAEEFIKTLIQEFGLSADRLLLCPGNHDLDQRLKVYEYEEERPAGYSDREVVKLDDGGWLVRNRLQYPRRFERFGKLYHNLLQRPYPLPLEDQGVITRYPETGIEFLALNTAWEIDRRFPDRASVNLEAVGKALLSAEKSCARLRIVVAHHALWAERQIANLQVISNLAKSGYRLYLHGDIHEETALSAPKGLHAIGTGSLGQGGEGTPRLYGLLEVDRDFKRVTVRRRGQRKAGGAFGPFENDHEIAL